MSGYFWAYPNSASSGPLFRERRAPNDTRGYATHLRGRVSKAYIGWQFEVVNTSTGQNVSYDNGHRDLDDAFRDAEFATAVARSAWMRGVTQKSLRRKS